MTATTTSTTSTAGARRNELSVFLHQFPLDTWERTLRGLVADGRVDCGDAACVLRL